MGISMGIQWDFSDVKSENSVSEHSGITHVM